VDIFSGGGSFCVALVRLRSYVAMNGVLGWTPMASEGADCVETC
jgi:hypothetical protein